MEMIDRPRLRLSINGQLDPDDDSYVILFDEFRLTSACIRLHKQMLPILDMFNGDFSLNDIQQQVIQAENGDQIPLQLLHDLVSALDEAYLLDSPRFHAKLQEYQQTAVREPACIGSYAGDSASLKSELSDLFTHEHGPGFPANCQLNANLRGALIPHIDYQRGGITFAWGYKHLVEQCDATTFVILGTSHYSAHRFTITRKDFRTPLGVVETDSNYVDQIAKVYGEDAFADEYAHLPEHSIEFQVIFLQYCLNKIRPFKIVPILVGSFHDCIEAEQPPSAMEDIASMIEALRQAEVTSDDKICYIASGDLAHLGPKFGDRQKLDQATLDWSQRQDQALLQHAEAADLDQFFQLILNERDQRRTCGFAPTYTLMATLQPQRGKLIHYDQYVEPNGLESVSFASLAFYK